MVKKKNQKKLPKNLIILIEFGLVFSLGLLLGVFWVSCQWIGNSVKDRCFEAQLEYGGDCVQALSYMVEDSDISFRKRDRAVWALGQVGDKRGLTVLEKYYDGTDECDHGNKLCQYEIKKAIKLINGFNLARLIYGPISTGS